MRELAQRLVKYESPGNSTSLKKNPSHFLVIEKLRPQLSTLMGNLGFGALLMRSHSLACADAPCLKEIRIQTNGTLEGFDDIETHHAPKEVFEGKVILVAQLLELLRAFIGEILTLRLVLEVWPMLPLDDPDSGIGEKHEK